MLTENELNRLIDVHTKNGFAIVSACRGECSEEENSRRTNELNSILKDSGFSFKKINGGFIENLGSEKEKTVKEKSFIIYNSKKGSEPKENELMQFALKLCRKYGQDSILYSEKGDKPRYYTKQGHVDSSFSNKFIFNDKKQEYFSEFGDNKRFTLDWEPNDQKSIEMKKKAKEAIYSSIETDYFNY